MKNFKPGKITATTVWGMELSRYGMGVALANGDWETGRLFDTIFQRLLGSVIKYPNEYWQMVSEYEIIVNGKEITPKQIITAWEA